MSRSFGPNPPPDRLIVHNRHTCPNLLRLCAELGATTQESEMSRSVRCAGCGPEYAGPAIEELFQLVGDVPVVLVGHSMGARAGLRAAARPRVDAVVTLAPWCTVGEPVPQLAGKASSSSLATATE